MSSRNLIVFIVVLIVLWVGAEFIFAPRSATPENPGSASVQAISAEHSFANGVHTISGSIDLPTPCYQLSSSTTVATTTSPQRVMINFTIAPPPANQFCAQVVTPTPFTVKVVASSSATFQAAVNGSLVPLTFTEPASPIVMPRATSTVPAPKTGTSTGTTTPYL